jgi:hypothetical protein
VAAILGMLEKLRLNLAEDTFWQDQNCQHEQCRFIEDRRWAAPEARCTVCSSYTGNSS